MGTASVNSSGVATLTITGGWPPGTYSLTASYGGSTDYNSSSSSTLTQTVNKASTSVALSSATSPACGAKALH